MLEPLLRNTVVGILTSHEERKCVTEVRDNIQDLMEQMNSYSYFIRISSRGTKDGILPLRSTWETMLSKMEQVSFDEFHPHDPLSHDINISLRSYFE